MRRERRVRSNPEVIVVEGARNGDLPTTDLVTCSAQDWDALIESIRPADLLAAIELRLGAVLKRRVTAEDILQEALYHAWRDRASFTAGSTGSFRRWLLAIIENRIRRAAEEGSTQKRKAELRLADLAPPAPGTESGIYAGPIASTRPSRAMQLREEAERIMSALESLPEDLREVVRLRLLEDRTSEEIASQLGIGVSAVQHRGRKGVELFRQRLTGRLDGLRKDDSDRPKNP